MTRLILAVPLSMEQQRTTTHLMDSVGECVCGRLLRKLDPKFVLGQINSAYAAVRDAQNTLVIVIYCKSCFLRINDMFTSLKNSATSGNA